MKSPDEVIDGMAERRSKQCENCGNAYYRRPTCGIVAWLKQRFCSRTCDQVARRLQREANKPTTWRCSQCNRVLPLEAFNRSNKRSLGITSECKNCTSRRGQLYRQTHVRPRPEKRRDRYAYNQRPEVKARRREQWHKLSADPDHQRKEFARREARKALRAGTIVKRPCITCGSQKSEMHHDDYANPLDVRWVCHTCHMLIYRPVRTALTALLEDQ